MSIYIFYYLKLDLPKVYQTADRMWEVHKHWFQVVGLTHDVGEMLNLWAQSQVRTARKYMHSILYPFRYVGRNYFTLDIALPVSQGVCTIIILIYRLCGTGIAKNTNLIMYMYMYIWPVKCVISLWN